MSEKITIKYFEESEFARQPICATVESAGYDLFAAQDMTLLPNSCESVSFDCIWEIPKGYCGKIYPHSSLVDKNDNCGLWFDRR